MTILHFLGAVKLLAKTFSLALGSLPVFITFMFTQRYIAKEEGKNLNPARFAGNVAVNIEADINHENVLATFHFTLLIQLPDSLRLARAIDLKRKHIPFYLYCNLFIVLYSCV